MPGSAAFVAKRNDHVLERAKELAAEELSNSQIIRNDRDRLVLQAGMAIGIAAALEYVDQETEMK